MDQACNESGTEKEYRIPPQDEHQPQILEKSRSEISGMNATDVMSGIWQSDLPGQLYVITQVGDRFMWRVMCKNGMVETGIGRLLQREGENTAVPVEAQWTVHSEQGTTKIGFDRGCMSIMSGRASEIRWACRERFFREK